MPFKWDEHPSKLSHMVKEQNLLVRPLLLKFSLLSHPCTNAPVPPVVHEHYKTSLSILSTSHTNTITFVSKLHWIHPWRDSPVLHQCLPAQLLLPGCFWEMPNDSWEKSPIKDISVFSFSASRKYNQLRTRWLWMSCLYRSTFLRRCSLPFFPRVTAFHNTCVSNCRLFRAGTVYYWPGPDKMGGLCEQTIGITLIFNYNIL